MTVACFSEVIDDVNEEQASIIGRSKEQKKLRKLDVVDGIFGKTRVVFVKLDVAFSSQAGFNSDLFRTKEVRTFQVFAGWRT